MAAMKLTDIRKLVPGLRVAILPRQRNIKGKEGEPSRMRKITEGVTQLIKEERIETSYQKGLELQAYTERLISEALRHGPDHKPTMEIADYYLLEKQLVHKLFKVLAPRYKDYEESCTSIKKLPDRFPRYVRSLGVLELKGNPYPPLHIKKIPSHNWINNILLDEARKEYNAEMYKKNHKEQ